MPGIDIDVLSPADKRELLRDLTEAYYLGATRVRFRERDVTYRSIEEMKAIITDLEAAIAGKPKRPQVVLTTFRRGV
ncbi:hypothetical protein J2X65_003501 [Ancylobacter sp. 3268]|uniref:phage head-tail joining protein n=1 Tax=Ancylobacter sp. 3268 TaxID=2817752 RepID=UPI002861F8DD|nr:hypothetical protein [Ancylobacter sp. 3268]MDR6954133.1 hypothetical protein [Ancylobacter sp. 3268]